jgi:hypothetical protein
MMLFRAWLRALVCACAFTCLRNGCLAGYVPNKFFAAMYTDYQTMLFTTISSTYSNAAGESTNSFQFHSVSPLPTSYRIAETSITGEFPPFGSPSGVERNEHQRRFATNGETSNGQTTGHKFHRSEAWDFSFDLKIDTPNTAPRKQAGFYLKSPLGDDGFVATTSNSLYSAGLGEISTLFGDIIPAFDFTAIDGMHYAAGDSLRMQLIYTPPVLNGNAFDAANPSANVAVPATLEYRILPNGGTTLSSGPRQFVNSWLGIPDNTLVMLWVQNVGVNTVVGDSSIVTFSNITVPEPSSATLCGLASLFLSFLLRLRGGALRLA